MFKLNIIFNLQERGSRLAEGRYVYVNAKKLNVLPDGDGGGNGEFDRYVFNKILFVCI